MIIKVLAENTSISKDYSSEHGLSLYIETEKHKISFNMGASEIFAENAEKLNVDLSEVDIAVISHGHYDHGGGLENFLAVNSKAKIYLKKNVFDNHYAKNLNVGKEDIGLNEKLSTSKRFIYVEDCKTIDKGIYIFSNIKGTEYKPLGNQLMFMGKTGNLIKDDFSHEQNLIIKENGIAVLLAGCAHSGIINILKEAEKIELKKINYVIGGFHLCSRLTGESESSEKVKESGSMLINSGSKYFTCYCTGLESYEILKDAMGDKIDYLATGTKLVI